MEGARVSLLSYSADSSDPVRRFWVGFDGSMSVTINPRQAIAIHAGARGVGVPIRKSAEQVSVLFYLTAISTPGEVRFLSIGRLALDLVLNNTRKIALVGHLRGGQRTAAR